MSLTKQQAVDLYKSKFWLTMSANEIVRFQLFENLLCIPMDVFHEALEKELGRDVFTHELKEVWRLQSEFLGDMSAPSFEEIMDLIPEEKRIIVSLGEDKP